MAVTWRLHGWNVVLQACKPLPKLRNYEMERIGLLKRNSTMDVGSFGALSKLQNLPNHLEVKV